MSAAAHLLLSSFVYILESSTPQSKTPDKMLSKQAGFTAITMLWLLETSWVKDEGKAIY